MKYNPYCVAGCFLMMSSCYLSTHKNTVQVNDVTSPLHMLQPEYKTPYGTTQPGDIILLLNRIVTYLDSVTPAYVVDQQTGEMMNNFKSLPANPAFAKADFRLTSYEWGVTYAGMINAAEATGDDRYVEYVTSRLNLLARLYPECEKLYASNPNAINPLKGLVAPHALDDCGALCASFIKAHRAGFSGDMRPIVDHLIQYISSREFRLNDGTLARNRPLPNTLWLDDLFMSVPALAQMGKLTGDVKYYDDAVKQVLQFSQRMFVAEKGLFMHGWVQDMDPHPVFHWGRANGWAFMSMADLLDVLPSNHPGYPAVLALFRAHARGLASYQSAEGFWHQLLDRHDTYLETSATAIYAYCFAKGINKGWLDLSAYGPCALLAWNAVSTKVTGKGQVDGTCVGTGMGFDPAFYAYRPVNVYAAHSYGPVLLAGSEMIRLLQNHPFKVNDSAVQFGESTNRNY